MNYYILDNQRPVLIEDVVVWGRWMEAADRRVAVANVMESVVSTVFIGLDPYDTDVPLLFETLVFGGPLDGNIERAATWEEAEDNHATICEAVRMMNDDDDQSSD